MTRAEVWKLVDRATALLAGRGWTKHAWARDAKGRKVDESSKDAACFCAVGAVTRAAYELGIYSTGVLMGGLISFNDREARTKWDVIRELERRAERICAELPE